MADEEAFRIRETQRQIITAIIGLKTIVDAMDSHWPGEGAFWIPWDPKLQEAIEALTAMAIVLDENGTVT